MADDVRDDVQDDAGRVLVRSLLIRPLQDAGLRRAKGQSERALADALDMMVTQLDHMAADTLRTLAESVLLRAAAPGADQGVWPAAVLIIAWGHGLQRRPFRLARVVWSWLGSIEGPTAEAGGYLVPLLRFLRTHRRPPTQYDLSEIKASAREDNRRLSLIADRMERGTVQAEDRAWHSAWLADQQLARQFVDKGRADRVAKTEGQAA